MVYLKDGAKEFLSRVSYEDGTAGEPSGLLQYRAEKREQTLRHQGLAKKAGFGTGCHPRSSQGTREEVQSQSLDTQVSQSHEEPSYGLRQSNYPKPQLVMGSSAILSALFAGSK